MASQVIAFDIGGTKMRAAIVKNHKIIKYIDCPTPKTRKKFLNQIYHFIQKFNSKKISGIGIGIAGQVKNGKILKAPNLALKNFDLKTHLRNKYKKKVKVINDAGCFALAELHLGFKSKNFILLTIGTGIGGGMVVNGIPYRGMGLGAEFGHMKIEGKDFESLWKKTKGKIQKEFGKGTLVSDLCKHKTLKGKKILTESAEYFGEGIGSLISALDPEIVILGGGVEESGKYFLKMIQKATKKHSFIKKKTPIKWTKLHKPGILGASLLVS